jgi:quercetin dioxygenase-like cupin family protein
MNIRRVVTDNNAKGKSCIKWDSHIEGKPGRPGFERVDLWVTETLPPKLTDHDPVETDVGTSVAGGSVLRICKYEPGVSGRWHATDSVDYAIVMSGELWMELEEGEVHLKPHDVVIQRSTNHNWVNRGSEPCVICFVLLATEGGKSTGW